MSRQAAISGATGPYLILFVADDSPRSSRARTNLKNALESAGMGDTTAREIDLLQGPEQAVAHGLFATPALLRAAEGGSRAILYGDLSDRDSLMRFLEDLLDTDSCSTS